MSQGLPSVHCNEAEGGSFPPCERACLGGLGRRHSKAGKLGREPQNWIHSVDPGDWEINHVLKRLSFKKTGSLLVRFLFSFGERGRPVSGG